MRPSRLLFDELKQWLNIATPEARNIVRRIVRDSTEPLNTHEVYRKSQEKYPLSPQEEEAQKAKLARLLRRTGPPPPPNAVHHIRSIRYLKTVVLPDLEKRNEIIKVHRIRPPTPEEAVISASLKPLTRSQRKNRGSVGPGKRPIRLVKGQVFEWLWRLKTQEDCERDRAEHERLKIEKAEELRLRATLRRYNGKVYRRKFQDKGEDRQKGFSAYGIRGEVKMAPSTQRPSSS